MTEAGAAVTNEGTIDGFSAGAPGRWKLWSPANIVIALSVGLIVVIFAIFALLCVQGYSTTLQQAETKAQTAADVVAEEAEWMLGGTQALLQHLASLAATPADITAPDRTSIEAALKLLPAPASFGVYDATGKAFADMGTPSLPATISGLDIFKTLSSGAPSAISTQLNDAATGAPIFVVAQKLPGAGFGGVALVVLAGDVMREFWTPQKLGPSPP